MNRDLYGRGDSGDAEPYRVRQEPAGQSWLPDPHGSVGGRRAGRGDGFSAPAKHRHPDDVRAVPRPGGRLGAEARRAETRRVSRGTSGSADQQVPERQPSRGSGAIMPLWQELPLLLVVAFCLAVLIRTFLLQAFLIPSGSMQYTLDIGDRVLVNKIVYDIRLPNHGEVVVFRGSDKWAPETSVDNDRGGFLTRLGRTIGDLVGVSEPNEKDFIKRVIGLPGDTVACCDVQGRVTVNGYPLDEPYVTDNSPLEASPTPGVCGPRRFGPVTVGEGQLWVMGDHRAVSQDSRCSGMIHTRDVIGRAFVILWPTKHSAGLPVPPTFEKVPRPFAAAELGPDRHSSGGNEAVPAASGSGEPAVPPLLDLFVPLAGIMSQRRVRDVERGSGDVGSLP